MAEENAKSDRSLIFILFMVLLAGASFAFFLYEYQQHQVITKGIKSGLGQLGEIYSLDQRLQEIPQNEKKQVDTVNPAPSTLINFFSNQVFVEQELEHLKSEHVFNILAPEKISETETVENISIHFKKITRLDLVKYIFFVEQNKRYIKLKAVEFKGNQKQTEDAWDVKLIFAYRRQVEKN